MAGGGFAVAGAAPSADYGGRVTFSVVVTCLMAASGGLIFGYDIGISGGVTAMESFLSAFFPGVLRRMAAARRDQYCVYDSHALTAFTSSLYLAGLAASLVASRVTKAVGRQAVMLAGGALFFAGAAVNAAAVNIAMLIVGRMLLGFGIGFTNQAAPVYLAETAPPKWRGAFTTGCPRRAPARQGPQGRRGRRAGGRVPRRRGGARPRGGRVPEDPPAGAPPPPGDGRGGAAVPAAHGGHRHRLLLARAVPDGRLRQRRRAHGRRRPRRREPGLHARLHRHRRPVRPPAAAPDRRVRHDHLPGRGGVDHGLADRRRRRVRDGEALLPGGAGSDVRVLGVVRVVVGAADLGDPRRDIPRGDPVGGAGHQRGRQPRRHVPAHADVPLHAVRAQVRHLHLLRGLGRRHDRFRGGVPAGDQGGAARGHGRRLGAPLVLGPLRAAANKDRRGTLM
ncbi:hypothetical protein PVAP13_7KG184155 [Panicum virgatum]|uniref:Major facilitator superfamily (MFS) profile domain-containing protein n=1 Tax=Panicum virgatum TaxID=38727 RepID=A0A8T0QMY0_PANVG|nr:hypothetical protein PVAP13_7KG184155 [Panicum virgatum]